VNHLSRSVLSAAAVGAISLGVTACGSDNSNTITLYSGRGENLLQPIIDQFEGQSDVDVDVKYGDTADLALLISEEADAGRTEADVFLSQSPGAMGFIDDDLAQLPTETLDLVDAAVRDDDGRWVGISGRQRVLVYNSDLVDEADLPTSVFDVADERWAGQIGVAGGNGSFQDFVTAMRFTEGEEVTAQWLEDIAALDPVSFPNNNAIVAAVGRGEVEIGLVNHYYNYRFLAEDPSLASVNHTFDNGDPGATLIVTAAAIIDGTDKADQANELIRFLLGEQGQQYFAEETFEYPLASGAEPAGGVPAIEFTDVGSIDLDELEGGLERTREMIAEAGLES
jgi:iron(III) transport system substrate-binding protein